MGGPVLGKEGSGTSVDGMQLKDALWMLKPWH